MILSSGCELINWHLPKLPTRGLSKKFADLNRYMFQLCKVVVSQQGINLYMKCTATIFLEDLVYDQKKAADHMRLDQSDTE